MESQTKINPPPPSFQDYKKIQTQGKNLEFGQRVADGFSPKAIPSQPLVSIITVVRNGGRTIERAIQSVLYQTYKNIEYIIIDGGSTDNTLEIIKKYKEQIAYCISQSDAGIADAFNKGIVKSTGDLVGILNSDDWYNPKAVELNVQAFLSHPDDIFHGDMKLVNECNGKNYILTSNEESLSYKCNINHAGMFVPAKVYKEVGLFILKFKVAMDYEWLLRAKTLGKDFFYIKNPITNMAKGGASDKRWVQAYLEVANIRRMYGKNILQVWLGFAFMFMTGLLSRTLQKLKLEALDIYLKNKVSKIKRIPA